MTNAAALLERGRRCARPLPCLLKRKACQASTPVFVCRLRLRTPAHGWKLLSSPGQLRRTLHVDTSLHTGARARANVYKPTLRLLSLPHCGFDIGRRGRRASPKTRECVCVRVCCAPA